MRTKYNIPTKVTVLLTLVFFSLMPGVCHAKQKVSDIRVVVRDARQEGDAIRVELDIEI